MSASPETPQRRPEVTVSMPAYNVAPFIRQALHSVLAQEGIDVEVIVVDDASTDDTAAVVESFDDPRLQLVRHATNRGIAACHNAVLARATAAVVAHVDADDMIMPGALRRLVDAVTANPRVGQAHCHFLDIDADGRVRRDAVHRRVAHFKASRQPPLDYRARLAGSAGIFNHLRTYPTAVLRALGGFDERLRYAEEYDMALRLLERHDIVLVPEYLYCWRCHPSRGGERLSAMRRALIRYRIRRRLVREGAVTYLDRPTLQLASVLRDAVRSAARAVARPLYRLRNRVGWAVRGPWQRARLAVYRVVVEATRRLPLHRIFAAPRLTAPERRRIAYYLGGFPILSETFIQREVDGLDRAGVSLALFAREPRGRAHFDERARRLMARTRYLGTIDDAVVRRRARRLMRRSPLRYVACRVFVTSRVHGLRKTPRRDAEVFANAVRLAGALDAEGIDHLHSPWANKHAFDAIVAAALLNIPYSVQARAYDMHREGDFALDDKLAHATFVITNTHYNAEILRGRLPGPRPPDLHIIRNGLDLDRFPPAPPPLAGPGPCRLLLVGRLVEQKGIEYLLRACRSLSDAGRSYSCVVVGPATEVNHAIALRKLLRSLDLAAAVEIAGPRSPDEVIDLYGSADIVVLPSVICASGARDVTPNVVLEAMAMRRPVVSTTVSGIPELVVHEETGLLVPPRDADALAGAIAHLMDRPALAQELGRRGRERVEALFDIGKNAGAYARLFRAPSPAR